MKLTFGSITKVIYRMTNQLWPGRHTNFDKVTDQAGGIVTHLESRDRICSRSWLQRFWPSQYRKTPVSAVVKQWSVLLLPPSYKYHHSLASSHTPLTQTPVITTLHRCCSQHGPVNYWEEGCPRAALPPCWLCGCQPIRAAGLNAAEQRGSISLFSHVHLPPPP